MEPIRSILSKEWPLTQMATSLRSWQFPKVFSQNNNTVLKNVSAQQDIPAGKSPTDENGVNSSKVSYSLAISKSESDVNHIPIGHRNPEFEFRIKHCYSPDINKTRSHNEFCLQNAQVNCENVTQDDKLKSKFDIDFIPEKKLGLNMQQTRQFHSKTDIRSDGSSQGLSSGILSKEALLSHHSQRYASHFAIFDPALAAINLAALQPSKTGFNVRNLISNPRKDFWDWGLPTDNLQIRTEGPSINENLVEFVKQKSKLPIDSKRITVEDKTSAKVRTLMSKAKAMNKEAEKYRLNATNATTKKQKRLYRTVSKVVIPNKRSSSEKQGTRRVIEKPFKRKLSTANLGFQTEKVPKRKTVMEKPMFSLKENIDDTPSTAYQPSASYKDVFYNIFNKQSRTPNTLANNLAVFNRAPLEIAKTTPKPALKSTLTSVSLNMRARGKAEKQLEGKKTKSQTTTKRTSIKNGPRSPFQKTKDSILSKPTQASFSTVTKSKINKANQSLTKITAKHLSTSAKRDILHNEYATKPNSMSVNKQHTSKKITNPPGVDRFYNHKATYSSKSKASNRVQVNQKPKIIFKSKSEGNLPKRNNPLTKINKQSSRTFSSFHPQRTYSYKLDANNIEPKKIIMSKKEIPTTKDMCTRNVHSQQYSIVEPIQDEVYQELLNLCSSSKHRSLKPTRQSVQESCRCSLNEKKEPEKKKGLVCRIANIFNIGCGRDSKCPSPGCTKCDK